MIEATVINYLSTITADGKKTAVPCYAERPEKEPSKPYIVVEKTGSSLENHVASATIAVQSWAQTLYEAAALNEEVKAAMEGITDLSSVSACRLSTDYNFTSTALKAYRYQAVFILTYYEEETDG